MRTAYFRIPMSPLNLNSVRQAAHALSWNRQAQQAKQVAAEAVLEARQGQAGYWDRKLFHRARVSYTFHFPDAQRRDPENSLTKPFTDALVGQGVLEDDDFSHIELVLQRGDGAKPPWTEIRVEGE